MRHGFVRDLLTPHHRTHSIPESVKAHQGITYSLGTSFIVDPCETPHFASPLIAIKLGAA